MHVTIHYHAQARAATGMTSQQIELREGESLHQLLRKLADLHGPALAQMVLTHDGAAHPSLLLFVGDEQVRPDSSRRLRDGDTVTMLSPISGG